MSEERSSIQRPEVENFLDPTCTANNGQFDFERYSPYIEMIKALFVPSLENRIYSGLEEFVYNEDSQLAARFPCVKKCINLATSWRDPLDTFCLKYKDVNVKQEMIKHLIKRLIRDGLIGCFVDSVVLNNRLNRISRDLDSLGIQKDWLGYLNVWNFINEKDYWFDCDCSVSSSPTLYSTTSLPTASDRFIVGSDLQLENNSEFSKDPSETRNVRKRSASHEYSEDVKVDHQPEASRSSFELSQDFLSSLKNSSNMFDQVYPGARSTSATVKNRNVGTRAIRPAYRTKHPKTNWKNECLKLHVRTVYSAESIETTRPIRTSYLSLPCNSQDLIYQIIKVEALPILSEVNSNPIRKKFEIKLYNICSCLNNIFSRMDGIAIRRLCLFCEIRHNYLNFKLKPCDPRRAKVTLFTARVMTRKNFRKGSVVHREGIDKTMQERRKKQESAEVSKYADNEDTFSDCNSCGRERKTVSSSSKSSSSTTGSSENTLETKIAHCGCEYSCQLENLSVASSIDKVIQKLKMSTFKDDEQDNEQKSKIQEVLNLLSMEKKENLLDVEHNVRSTSTQTLEPKKFSRGINIDLIPTESAISLKSNGTKAASSTELNMATVTDSPAGRSYEKYNGPEEPNERKIRESFNSSNSWSRSKKSVESEKSKDSLTSLAEESMIRLKVDPSSIRNTYDRPTSFEEGSTMHLEPSSLRNSHVRSTSFEEGSTMHLEPSSLRNSYNSPTSFEDGSTRCSKMEPSSLRNLYDRSTSFEEGSTRRSKVEPSSLRNSYDPPTSLEDGSTRCSKMEPSSLRNLYDRSTSFEEGSTRRLKVEPSSIRNSYNRSTSFEEGSTMHLVPSSLQNSYDRPTSFEEGSTRHSKVEPSSIRNSYDLPTSFEEGSTMHLVPSSLRNSGDPPTSFEEGSTRHSKVESLILRNPYDRLTSFEEGSTMHLVPSSLRDSGDHPTSFEEGSTMSSKVEQSSLRHSYEKVTLDESRRAKGSSSASTKSVRFDPCRSICSSKNHRVTTPRSQSQDLVRSDDSPDAGPRTRDNYTTMKSTMNSRSFCETLSNCSIDRLKHLIKAKLRRRFLKTKSVRSTSASTSKTFLSNDKYYLSVSSGKASRLSSRNQSRDSVSNSIDSVCTNSYNNDSPNSFTPCGNRTYGRKFGNIYYSDVEDYSLRKFKKSDALGSESSCENRNSASSTFDHGDLRGYDRKIGEIVGRSDQEQTSKILRCRCDCDCSLKTKKKRKKSFSQGSEHSKEFLTIPSNVPRSFSNQNGKYEGVKDDENESANTINPAVFCAGNQSRRGHQGQSAEYRCIECCCSNGTILCYPVTIFLRRDHNKENSADPVLTQERIEAFNRESNFLDRGKSSKNLHRSRCNYQLSILEEGHLDKKNDSATLKLKNDRKATFDDLDRDFRSKLSQYVSLCKNVKHSLLKKLRPDDIYEVSKTSIPCTDRYECREP